MDIYLNLDKWKIENANLPKKLQRPTPIRPGKYVTFVCVKNK